VKNVWNFWISEKLVRRDEHPKTCFKMPVFDIDVVDDLRASLENDHS
jgi:hypothetical protein